MVKCEGYALVLRNKELYYTYYKLIFDSLSSVSLCLANKLLAQLATHKFEQYLIFDEMRFLVDKEYFSLHAKLVRANITSFCYCSTVRKRGRFFY